METPYSRMARQRALERDADAALRALSSDERETLRRTRTGDILDVPTDHQDHLVELCLGKHIDAGFALTELGRCAADRLSLRAPGESAAREGRRRAERPLVHPLTADWP